MSPPRSTHVPRLAHSRQTKLQSYLGQYRSVIHLGKTEVQLGLISQLIKPSLGPNLG